MLLDNLKDTWKLYQRQSDLALLQSDDILAIIQANSASRKPMFFLNIALLLMLVLMCTGG